VADLVLLLHFLFVLFVALGGVLALWWRRVVWLHVPAVVWGVWIELSGSICPLTPLENRLRRARGEAEYEGDFIAHYILPVLYPEGLTRSHQLALAALALFVNVFVYALVFARHRRTVAKDI
jgi:hypothetical protein